MPVIIGPCMSRVGYGCCPLGTTSTVTGISTLSVRLFISVARNIIWPEYIPEELEEEVNCRLMFWLLFAGRDIEAGTPAMLTSVFGHVVVVLMLMPLVHTFVTENE